MSKVLITVFILIPHILLNLSGLNNNKDLDLTTTNVKYMFLLSLFLFNVLLDWWKAGVSEIIDPRLKHEISGEIVYVPSNNSRTDSVSFKWASTF